MTSDIKSILNNQLPVVNSVNTSTKQIPIAQVDDLADELVTEYANPDYRRWYCGVINKYGVRKVMEWHRRASEGNTPARLFSKYVSEAGGYHRTKDGA